MGEFNTVGLEDIIDAFSRREAATVEAVPKMLKAGADVLIEAQRAEAQAMGLNETGGFINSIKATDVKGDDTEKYVEIYPQGRAKHGNDRKGDKSKVRYATIGFVAEYGTSSPLSSLLPLRQCPCRPYRRYLSEFCRSRHKYSSRHSRILLCCPLRLPLVFQ